MEHFLKGKFFSLSVLVSIIFFNFGFCYSQENVLNNEDCFTCHKSETLIKRTNQGKQNLHINSAEFKKSIHGNLACLDCHETFTKFPHPKNTNTAQCISCHTEDIKEVNNHNDIHVKYKGSSHYTGQYRVDCTDCHRVHEDVKGDFKEAVSNKCQDCHSIEDVINNQKHNFDYVDAYFKSFHGRSYNEKTAESLPNCVTCHKNDVHSIGSKEYSENFHKTTIKSCNAVECHPGINEKFLKRNKIHKSYLSFKYFDVFGFGILIMTLLVLVFHSLIRYMTRKK
jgi:hypothetical protein